VSILRVVLGFPCKCCTSIPLSSFLSPCCEFHSISSYTHLWSNLGFTHLYLGQ
jgi:hypothetical protein